MANISVSVATTETKLVSLDTVKARLGISVNTYDSVLADLIEEASDAVVQHLQRPLAYQTYAEQVAGYDDRYLLLSRVPLVSLTSILNDTTTVSSTTYEIFDHNAGIVFNSTGWEWDVRFRGDIASDPVPYSEERQYTVTYTAGYALPGVTTASSTTLSTAAETLPKSITRATVIAVKEWFDGLGLDVTATQYKSIRTEDFQVETHANNAAELCYDLPEASLNLLRPFEGWTLNI